jgi:hypothetical protein
MRQEHCIDIYDLYDEFIKTFLFKGNSIISSHEAILNQESINQTVKNYIDNYDDGVESFDDKIKIQFSNAL